MPGEIRRLQDALADRYAIQHEVGHGAAAIVYLAQDLRHGRPVALKVLRAEVARDLGPDRFLREIRITARLQHPHILPLLEAGEAAGRLYYAMPYVEGHSLRLRLARERHLPIEDAVRIAQDVASALSCAHGHDVLHRDIKPENILLSAGQAVVADFGIARAVTLASDGESSSPGLAIGTPDYMSPEQAAGSRDLDGRTDVYALGCVLYEMLAGETPYAGATTQAIMARHALDPIPPLRTVRPTVAEDLERAIAKALAKVPADRFATAAEFSDALAPYGGPKATRVTPVPVSPARPANSIAVVPFANLSPDPDNEYFSDGLSEELLSGLSKLAGLRVAARTSAFAFKGKDMDVRAIGRELGVGTVLTGSVRKAGSRLRITAQLVNTADGYQLWAEQYDRQLDDVFAIQEEITAAIVKVLKLTLLGGERAAPGRPASGDVAAYELYLRGRYFWNKRTEPGLEKAIEYFRQAIAQDAAYAPAFAGLADCYTILAIYGARPPRETMPLAKEAAEQALQLDPALAEAHASLGCVRAMFDLDWHGAEREFRRAIDCDPYYPTAHHWYALNCLAPLGRCDEAATRMQVARDLDPLSPVITTSVGVQEYFARHYDRAIDACRRTLELDERFPIAHYFLGLAQTELGGHDEAIAELKQAAALTGGTVEISAALAYAYARAGRHDDARAVLTELLQRSAHGYVSPALLGQVYAGLGDHERALASLEAAYEERAVDLAWLKVRPVFDGVRDDARYHALVRKMGLLEPGPA